MYILSKSTYIRSLQCQKSLYLYKNFYKQKDPIPVNRQLIFNRGHSVGILAQRLFPGGMDVSPRSPFKWPESAKNTRDLINKGQEIIYEAAFIFEGVLAAVDILVKSNTGYHAFEVKSSLDVKEIHIRDSALQYYVISNSNINLTDFSLVHINRNFIKNGPIDVNEFFSTQSVLSECKQEQDFVKQNITGAKQTLALKEIPDVHVGKHCFLPYPCDFEGTCWKDYSKPNVFDLEQLTFEKQIEWFEQNIVSFDDIMHYKKVTKLQRTQILSTSENKELYDKNELSNYFLSFTYPLHFIDILNLCPAVPVFDGAKPFEKTPFTYSLITKDVFDTTEHHKYYIAEPGYHPFPHILKHLLNHIQPLGDIFICNKNSVIKLLQKYFDPEDHSTTAFDSFISRCREFYFPFTSASYYHPKLKSNSTVKEMHSELLTGSINDMNLFDSDMVASTKYEELVYENDLLEMAESKDNIHAYCQAKAEAMHSAYNYLKELISK